MLLNIAYIAYDTAFHFVIYDGGTNILSITYAFNPKTMIHLPFGASLNYIHAMDCELSIPKLRYFEFAAHEKTLFFSLYCMRSEVAIVQPNVIWIVIFNW